VVGLSADLASLAETLLESLRRRHRARAYVDVGRDAGANRLLRPELIPLPVVQMHMAMAREPARYTYAAKVFRRSGNGATPTVANGNNIQGRLRSSFDRGDSAAGRLPKSFLP